MKLEKIEFEELFPTGIYANQRFRAIASIEPHEGITECYRTLKDSVEKAFVELNPQISWHTPEPIPEMPIIPRTNEEKRQETIQGWVATINSMATKSGLENLRPLIEKTKIPELTEAFDNKIKEFQ